mmetsp:Transcript_10492/g.10928  ORF Transcript_10492/g.10928 Transcript_10492/m.10928 type:complete len:83 (-) Transcript_10492:58-306(-)
MEEQVARFNRIINNKIIQRSFIWGAICTGLISAHKLRLYPRSVRHAAVSGIVAFFVGTLVNLNYTIIRQRREQMRNQKLMQS